MRKVAEGKYVSPGSREILNTTTLYSDGKTQVPKNVIEFLRLERGSQIVWIKDGEKIVIESPRI